jgi:hypothetical protein
MLEALFGFCSLSELKRGYGLRLFTCLSALHLRS